MGGLGILTAVRKSEDLARLGEQNFDLEQSLVLVEQHTLRLVVLHIVELILEVHIELQDNYYWAWNQEEVLLGLQEVHIEKRVVHS